MTTAARERPILFSGPMVRAILDGKKTQTRRVIKPQPPAECGINYPLGNESWIGDLSERTPLRHTWEAWHGPLYQNRPEKFLCGVHTVASPFGAPGDRLWVRESFRGPGHFGEEHILHGYGFQYEADGAFRSWGECGCEGRCGGVLIAHKLRPSIHMPRWASRITLEITDVRAQRLQEISDSDCLAEGVDPVVWESLRADFGVGWDHLNAKRGYSWASNPWVWAISFRRVTDG